MKCYCGKLDVSDEKKERGKFEINMRLVFKFMEVVGLSAGYFQ